VLENRMKAMASSNATTIIAAVSISTMKVSCAKYRLSRSVEATLASTVTIATLFEVIFLERRYPFH